MQPNRFLTWIGLQILVKSCEPEFFENLKSYPQTPHPRFYDLKIKVKKLDLKVPFKIKN
jgi:hypothetical protein